MFEIVYAAAAGAALGAFGGALGAALARRGQDSKRTAPVVSASAPRKPPAPAQAASWNPGARLLEVDGLPLAEALEKLAELPPERRALVAAEVA